MSIHLFNLQVEGDGSKKINDEISKCTEILEYMNIEELKDLATELVFVLKINSSTYHINVTEVFFLKHKIGDKIDTIINGVKITPYDMYKSNWSTEDIKLIKKIEVF